MAEMTENMKKRKPKEKKLSRFAGAVIIYALSLSVIITALICTLAAFLHTYEENLPSKTAEKFVSELEAADLAALIENTLGEISELEDSELILSRAEYLNGEIKQAKLAKEYTSSVPVYRLICGEHDVGRLTLRRAEKDASFGIARFEVDTAELYTEAVPGAKERLTYTVCLPEGAVLYANGRAVSPGYITSNEAYSGKCVLGSYEGNCDIYTLDGLCTPPILEAVYEGETSVLSFSGNHADWFALDGRTFFITVPSDAELKINGKVPSPSLAERGTPDTAVSEYEKHLGDALPAVDTYTVSGNIQDTEIKVSVRGVSLDADSIDVNENGAFKGRTYIYSAESLYSVRAVVPEGATLYINGVAVPQGSEKVTYTKLEDVKYLSDDPEALSGVLYEIGGLLCAPEVSAKIGDAALPVSYSEKTDRRSNVEFYGAPDEAADAASLSAADSFTRAYFHYVANGAVGIEENYGALIALMKPSSPGYKQIRNSKSSFEFVNQGVYRIDELLPRDIISLGGNMFCCQVDFAVNLRFYRNEKLYIGTLSLTFVREGDAYLVCDMVIDSEG